jgi:predicted phosphodiesterase
MKHELQFRPDGTFTIVQLTDLHILNGDENDSKTKQLASQILETERPDLIVVTGDLIEGNKCERPYESFRDAVSFIDGKQIPWAFVFGNHDAENGTPKEKLMDMLQETKYGLTEPGPAEIHGMSNYVLPILAAEGSRTAACLYMLDSGEKTPTVVRGYDWIRHDQIGWYRERSSEMTARNGGTPLPALAFFHIPLPEYADLWNFHTCYGVHKDPAFGCPRVNSGFFASAVEMGDVMGIFVGHCHGNDFQGTLHGIRLCHGRACGFNGYGREGLLRGARVIRLRQDERGFETWIRQEDGTVDRQETPHSPA